MLVCGLVFGLAGISTAAPAAIRPHSSTKSRASRAGSTHATRRAAAYWTRHIRRSQAGTRRWLTVIEGRPPRVASAKRFLAVHSVQGLRRLARVWQRREHAVWRRANHPPDLAAWLCIHSYEGSWSDPGAPYWGGLQMDLSFQESYGGWLLHHKGTADHWSELEQIWTAVRAWRVRGFSPWPATAHACGLI